MLDQPNDSHFDEEKIDILRERHEKIMKQILSLAEKNQDLLQENEFLCIKISETELELKSSAEEKDQMASSLILSSETVQSL